MVKEEGPKGLDLHIYNFLITEGHFDVAKTFAKEANISTKTIAQY